MFANVYCSLIVYCYSAVVDVEGVRTSARLTYNAKKLAEFAFGLCETFNRVTCFGDCMLARICA